MIACIKKTCLIITICKLSCLLIYDKITYYCQYYYSNVIASNNIYTL